MRINVQHQKKKTNWGNVDLRVKAYRGGILEIVTWVLQSALSRHQLVLFIVTAFSIYLCRLASFLFILLETDMGLVK